MNWNDIRYFLAVARSGRLTRAGSMLGVDHATVSRRIASLEAEIGAKLFDRSPKGYSLTGAGSDLVPVAKMMESNAIKFEATIGTSGEKLSGPVRIGVPEGVAAYIVSRAASDLCKKYPLLEIQLIALPRKFSLSNREADFVISVSRPKTGRLKVQKICDYSLHLYGLRSFVEEKGPFTSVADLHRVMGIGYVPELIFDKELDYIPLVDPNFRPRLSSTSVHVQLEAVLQGAGVGIVHDFMARRYDDLVQILPQEISFNRSFWGIVHEDYADLERIKVCSTAIIECMRNELKLTPS